MQIQVDPFPKSCGRDDEGVWMCAAIFASKLFTASVQIVCKRHSASRTKVHLGFVRAGLGTTALTLPNALQENVRHFRSCGWEFGRIRFQPQQVLLPNILEINSAIYWDSCRLPDHNHASWYEIESENSAVDQAAFERKPQLFWPRSGLKPWAYFLRNWMKFVVFAVN